MKVNLKLLKKLYLIDHPSGSENDMISFILNYCYRIPKITLYLDHYNNLFITKNTTNPEQFACIVAHMDTVHSFNKQRELVIKDGVITAQYINNKMQCGLNADDCNGILVALQLLEVLPNLKVCFTVEEEIGGKGANEAAFNTDFFENVQFLIQADRRGSRDLIVYTNGIESASFDFLQDIEDLLDAYDYEPEYGTFTDIGVLAEQLSISGVNVSCGYYNEHTFKECCNIAQLKTCLNFIHDIIVKLQDNGKTYTINPTSYSHHDYYNYGGYYRDYSSTTANPCKYCSDFDCMNCKKNVML